MLLSLVVVAVLHAADAPAEFDAWLDSPKSLALTDARTAETLDLLAHTWVTAVEPRRGVPSFLWAERFPNARTPRDQGLTATEAARLHLLRHAPLYRLSGALVAGLVVSEVHDLGKGAVIVGFARAHEGVPLLRDELDVVMTERYELVALTGSLATAPRPHGAFRLDAPSALAAAAQHLTGRFVEPSAFEPRAAREGAWALFDTGSVFTAPPRARRVYFDDTDAVLPAWHLELEAKGRLFAVVISAVDGRLLSRVNLEAHAAYTYTVWADPSAPFRPLDSPVGDVALPHPTSLPDAFNPPALAPIAVTLEHGGLSTNDPWLPAGAIELSGNNIHAYADLVAPDGLDGGDFTIAPSGANAFNFTYALTQNADAASTQRAASATQAFFVTNWLHDALYDLGFDEAAGNGQRDNFTRGGLGGDAINVEVHDYDGANNATMRTPADGAPGRMQLFLFDEPRPSTLTVTSTAYADGGLFAPAPPAVTLTRAWDVTGPVRTVRDLDGGFAGCDPWPTPAQYTGAVVVVDGTGCPLTTRYDAARDAGVAALLVSVDGCFGLTEPTVVAACLEPDAGTRLLELTASGATSTARLVRPPPLPQRDVALDTTVVAHEYTHFLTNRLVADSEGLFNSPARAMGEGWSDFMALWFSLRDGEQSRPGNAQWQGSYAIGGWSTAGRDDVGAVLPAHYFGVRRYPYSTDRAKNPLTFKHVGLNVPLPTTAPRGFGGGANNAEVHNAGEVWASMWWDAQVKLLNQPGATVELARTTMGRYLVASLKATPALPTFIEARDALLAVVQAESPTVDFPLVLDAFAQRGLGVLAQASDRRSTTNTPLAEDFTGAGGNYRLVSMHVDDTDDECDSDGQLDTGETGTLTLTLMNIGSKRLSRTTLRLSPSLGSVQLSTAPLTVPPTEPFTTVTLTTPIALARGVLGLQTLTVTVQASDPDLALPQHLFEASAPLRLNADLVSSTKETFEAGGEGWALEGDGDFPWEDQWFIRQSAPATHFAFGPDPRAQGTSHLTSPPLAVGASDFSVSWSQAYGFENATTFFDGGRLELSTDGVTFTPVPGSALSPTYPVTLQAGTTNPLAGQPAFGGSNQVRHVVTASFGTQYANRTVWLRWTIGADVSGSGAGWTVDDVEVSGLITAPFTELVAHRGQCTNHPPMVSGTSSINVAERDEVMLVPGALSDRDGDTLTTTWMQTSGPSVQVQGDTFVAPEVGPLGGVLGFRVTVDDGRGGSDTDDMTVSVRNVNRKPELVGTTGPQSATSGETVTLGVTGADPDGDPLTWQWKQQGESTVTLQNATAETTSFVAPEVKVSELITFTVVALDGNTASEEAYVSVVINPKPSSCACTSVEPLLGVALALTWLRRRRRITSS